MCKIYTLIQVNKGREAHSIDKSSGHCCQKYIFSMQSDMLLDSLVFPAPCSVVLWAREVFDLPDPFFNSFAF